MTIKTQKLLKFIFILLILLQLPFIFYYLNGLVKNYLTCPNRDFMTWDPELRFILTFNMMDDLRNFKVFHFLLQILDSPHWPSLRNIIQTIVFFIFSPTTDNDIYITFVTFVLVLLASFWIYLQEAGAKNRIWVPFLFFVTWSAIFRTGEYLLYTFTGMMEVQGSLFFLLSIYLLAMLYQQNIDNDQATGLFTNKRSYLILLFATTQLLYQSKYPYGYMLIIAIVFFHGLFYFRESFAYGLLYLKQSKPWLLLALGFLITHLLLPKEMAKGKTLGYLKYLFVLFMFLDFLVYFIKTRKERLVQFKRITILLQWVILPIVIWFLLNPDRLMSSTGQMTHFEVQGYLPGQVIKKNIDYYLVFVIEFIISGFSEMGLAVALLGLNLLLISHGSIVYVRTREIRKSFYISLIIFLTFLSLSLFTTNRHIRHTLHLYPAMIVAPMLYILENFQWLSIGNKTGIGSYIVSALIMILLSVGFIISPLEAFKTEICYTGYYYDDYKLPRWVGRQLPAIVKTDAILLNKTDPTHVNHADTEFVIHQYTYANHLQLLTDPNLRKPIPKNYKTLIIPYNTCADHKGEDKIEKITSNLEKAGRKLIPQPTIENEIGCIQAYGIE